MTLSATRPPSAESEGLENALPTSAHDFPATAPAANPVFYRTYSRKTGSGRESWREVAERSLAGLRRLGHLSEEEVALLRRMQLAQMALPSGRWLWIGGTEWIERSENFSGAYNCTSTNLVDWEAFALMMDLAMMGCGTGAIIEPHLIARLPVVRNELVIDVVSDIGGTPPGARQQATTHTIEANRVAIKVGDTRHGWVESYRLLLQLCSDERFDGPVHIAVDLADVRPVGETLKGFGGMANPVKLKDLYGRVAQILNKAIGRQLTSVECCLLIDEAAVTIVAGNIRRCLPEDALVHTGRGLVPIRDVMIGDMVQTPIGMRRVVDKFDQGVQEVVEIETNATVPRATLNHRMATLSDARGGISWKRISELQPADRLLHSTQVLSGTVTSLPTDNTAKRPEGSRTAKPITIPPLTSEVAWLIGYTHGDGYVALGRNKHGKPYGRVEWAMNSLDPVLTDQIRGRLSRALALFGLDATHGTVNGENTAKSICSSIRLAEYFNEHVKQPNTPLQVPAFILQGSIDVRAAYLAGLIDSDGAVNNRPPHLLTTVYRGFARQVGAVLSSLGIAGRTSIVRATNGGWQPKFNLLIPALKASYNSLIAPHSAKGKLKQGLKMNGFSIPGELMREAYTYSEMRSMGFEGSRATASNYERYVEKSELDLDIPVSFKAIGSTDSIHTYDIEVEEAHCFYCDGYLTHNSAGMRQFSADDIAASTAKDNLWQQDAAGNWSIDPERDSLRMANHTRVFHTRPSREVVLEAVIKQFQSGEGAIQFAPEAIARSNADLLPTPELREEFVGIYCDQGREEAARWLRLHHPGIEDNELEHRLGRYGLNPCGEILGADFHCNLAEIHLNRIDPHDFQAQEDAFKAGGIAVACLLNHRFEVERYRQSRAWDPIVGVSFTGLFDFFVHAFGTPWLQWWEAGRPDSEAGRAFRAEEGRYLSRWKEIVNQAVWEYCDRHGIRRPNRCTTVQPAGTKSLLTGASPGWHPPKAQRFIRRITFRKNDPVALACMDYGYTIVPSQSDKDENGRLLDDPFDPRCTEWLVEIPTEVSWANLPGADAVEINEFSSQAQFDFYMQVQRHYTSHNTSATVEFREHEIEALADAIHHAIDNGEGYISAALLARFDANATFPRLPFEPIDAATYKRMHKEVEARRRNADFFEALRRYDSGELMEAGPAGCDSDKCLLPLAKPAG